MIELSNFFQRVPLPSNMIHGSYSLSLVAISYGIAFFSSYIALDFAGKLRIEPNQKIKWYWLMGGAFSMGAGIWSMHFIGMLAFIMPMPMSYDPVWTLSSMIVVIISAGFALFLLRDETSDIWHLSAGGIILGFGIATMHYMGMAGMNGMNIHYLPGLFILSVVIAIVASEVALWFVLNSSKGSFVQQIRFKLLSALILGAAICGMHYTGMAAAIFTPLQVHPTVKSIEPYLLSLYITGLTGAMLTIALIVSIYKQLLASSAQNEKFFLNAVLNNLFDGVLACDLTGKITVVNPAFKQLVNSHEIDHLKGEWIKSFSLHRLKQEKPIPFSEFPINRALGGDIFEGLELELDLKNNGFRHNVIVSGQPIFNIDGEKLGAVIALHDITGSKKAKELEYVNKELEAFAYITSHDLKAPLRAIESLTSWIKEDCYANLNDESRKHFDLLKQRAQHMSMLIDGILHYSLIGLKHIETSNVNVRKLLADIILSLSVPSHFNIKISSNMPTLVTPEILLRQVFSNLISNAIKHHKGAQGNIEIRVSTSDNYYQFLVKDDGPGIPAEYQDKIFGMYQTLNSAQDTESIGIGLAIVKKAVARVNGKVWVQSEKGHGSEFYFTWPATYIDE